MEPDRKWGNEGRDEDTDIHQLQMHCPQHLLHIILLNIVMGNNLDMVQHPENKKQEKNDIKEEGSN